MPWRWRPSPAAPSGTCDQASRRRRSAQRAVFLTFRVALTGRARRLTGRNDAKPVFRAQRFDVDGIFGRKAGGLSGRPFGPPARTIVRINLPPISCASLFMINPARPHCIVTEWDGLRCVLAPYRTAQQFREHPPDWLSHKLLCQPDEGTECKNATRKHAKRTPNNHFHFATRVAQFGMSMSA